MDFSFGILTLTMVIRPEASPARACGSLRLAMLMNFFNLKEGVTGEYLRKSLVGKRVSLKEFCTLKEGVTREYLKSAFGTI